VGYRTCPEVAGVY